MTDTELREIEKRYSDLGPINLGGVAKQAIADVQTLTAEVRRLHKPVQPQMDPLTALGIEVRDDKQKALALLERIAIALEAGLKNGEADG